MQKAKESKTAEITQWRRPGFLYKSVLGLFAAVTLIGVFVIAVNGNKSSNVNTSVEIDQKYMNFSDEAKSSVCETLPAEKIGQAIGNEIGDTQRLLPDTETDEGTIAGCRYVALLKADQKLQSVSIVTQTYKDEARAVELFSVQTSKGKPVDDLMGSASYVTGVNPQLLIRDGSKITIITGITVSSDISDVESELVAIAKL